MGESKRRREKDPNYGKRVDVLDLKNIFFVENADDDYFLVVNTGLIKHNFPLLPDEDVTELFYGTLLDLTFTNLEATFEAIINQENRLNLYHVERQKDLTTHDFFYGVLDKDKTRFTFVRKLNIKDDMRSVNVGLQPESSKIGFVLASELSNVRIHGEFHVWQVLDGTVKSFTNSLRLANFEKSVNFDIGSFFRLMVKKQGRETPKDGFYWVNHYKKTASYFPCTAWTKECENALVKRGVIELANKN